MDSTVDTSTRKELIKKQNVFAKLTNDETDALAELMAEKHFETGDTLVKEGDLVDSILFLVAGRADVRHVRMQEGKETIRSLALMGPGQVVGLNETGFYSLTGKRTATVVALTPVTALYLSMPRFHGFALAYPHVSEILRELAEKRENSSN